jgi:hypothetical protein
VAVETNALVGVEDGGFPEHALQPAHAANEVLDFGFAEDGLTMLSFLDMGDSTMGKHMMNDEISSTHEFLQLFLLCGDDLLQGLLQRLFE